MKRIAPGYYEGTHESVRFTVTKVEGKNEWYWQINNCKAQDLYFSKSAAVEAAKDWIEFSENTTPAA